MTDVNETLHRIKNKNNKLKRKKKMRFNNILRTRMGAQGGTRNNIINGIILQNFKIIIQIHGRNFIDLNFFFNMGSTIYK